MATVDLTVENFKDAVSGSDITLVDFWAAWCGPCRKFGPLFEKFSDRHPGVLFGKVDTEAHPALAQAFQITSIPAVVAIRDKVVLYAKPGPLSEQALEDLLTRARDLDTDQAQA
ncbi:MAG: thioredoxin family protein [Streptomyces sp.]|jgi:thioredoxin 1|nr:thioredoxin family protein [Streptomyces sp.]